MNRSSDASAIYRVASSAPQSSSFSSGGGVTPFVTTASNQSSAMLNRMPATSSVR